MRKYFDAHFSAVREDLHTQFSELKNEIDSTRKSINEVSESVNLLATHADKRFDTIDDNLTALNHSTHNHEKRIAFLEETLPKLA